MIADTQSIHSPVICTDGVEKELNSVFLPEVCLVVLDDGGEVLNVTWVRHTNICTECDLGTTHQH